MIKKKGRKYVVLSETTDRYRTLKEAKHRLREVEFFKRLGKNPAMRKTIRKKSLLK
ncbi:MAG: hypothetical protein AAB533_03505 [Patescibacteria group bacterium]